MGVLVLSFLTLAAVLAVLLFLRVPPDASNSVDTVPGATHPHGAALRSLASARPAPGEVLWHELSRNPLRLATTPALDPAERRVEVRGRRVKASAILWERHRPLQDAVLAMGMGYEPRVWTLFVGSLRAAGFRGDVVVGVSEADAANAEIRRLAQRHDVILYVTRFQCEAMAAGRKKPCVIQGFYEETGGPTPEPAPISNLRYELLRAWASVYSPTSTLMLADFRDLYFQADPFPQFRAALAPAGADPAMLVVEEARGLTIGLRGNGNGWNTQWVHKCYGADVVQALHRQRVLCSGTSAGNQAGIITYLDLMLAELAHRSCKDVGGADQGIHNFLMRTVTMAPADAAVSPLKVFFEERGRGAVNTLSALVRLEGPLDQLGLRDAEGFVLNTDGSRSAVVHQWDRDVSLKHWVRQTFSLKLAAQ